MVVLLFPGLDVFKVRSEARRAVMGLVVDHELELTEIRIRQLDPVTILLNFYSSLWQDNWNLKIPWQ